MDVSWSKAGDAHGIAPAREFKTETADQAAAAEPHWGAVATGFDPHCAYLRRHLWS